MSTQLSSGTGATHALKAEINVEVAYAGPDEQAVVALTVAVGTSVLEAIKSSGLLQRFPEIDLSRSKVGIFGELTSLDRPLQAQDRVEIYRPLYDDPRELRRRRMALRKGPPSSGSSR